MGGQNRLKTSASHSQGHCGFQFSVAIADESSRKSRFNSKPSGEHGEQQAEWGGGEEEALIALWLCRGEGEQGTWLVLRESSIYPPSKCT